MAILTNLKNKICITYFYKLSIPLNELYALKQLPETVLSRLSQPGVQNICPADLAIRSTVSTFSAQTNSVMDNQKILRIVLSLAIVAAFFLPLSSVPIYGTELSAWSLLKNGLGNISQFSAMQLVTFLCLLVVFLCVVVNLILAVLRKRTSVLFNLLPLLAIIAIIVFTMTHSKENVGETLQSFGTGFYIMFIGSFLLPFTSIAVTPVNA